MNKKNELACLMTELSSHVVLGGKKYFHARTVENLIYHFDDIKSEVDKEWVFDALKEYFNDSLEIFNDRISFILIIQKKQEISYGAKRGLGLNRSTINYLQMQAVVLDWICINNNFLFI